jgi:arylsulfatase A-like enzyme
MWLIGMQLVGIRRNLAGKWHCGARSTANLPVNRGFDTHYGFLKGGEDHMTQILSDQGVKPGYVRTAM